MKRNALIRLLKTYSPSIEEFEYKDDMIRFAKKHQDCFDRSLTIGHFTASAWLLSKDRTNALLMHHTKLDQWLQLGGHCDGNPHLLEVAIKEAQEESGIHNILPIHEDIFDIDIHLIPANSKDASHLHYDVRFLLQVMSTEKVVANLESKELRWIGQNKLELPKSNPSIIRMFQKWITMYPSKI